MEKKYLPIGSVCIVKGQTKKIMITGYCSVEYNGNIKVKDYIGCLYPEGLLLPNSTISFNHSEIEKVEYLGYKDEENEKFQANLNSLIGDKADIKKSLTTDSIFSRIEFDENGVVTFVEMKESNKVEPVKEEKVETKKEEPVVNPFHKEYEDKPSSQPKKSELKMAKYEFDENGFVVAVNEFTEEEKENALNDIKPVKEDDSVKGELNAIEFDENGNIVGI